MRLPLWTFIAGCAVVGCSKSDPNDGANLLDAPGDYLKNTIQAERSATKIADKVALNKAIELFYVHEGRFPQDLMELVTKSYLGELPELPAGMAWEYDATNGIASVKQEGLPDIKSQPTK